MARFARLVVPGCAHHVTQRGNHHQNVFLCDDDRVLYLGILRDHCRRYELGVIAWCLMSNHVHLVAIPAREDTLAKALGRTHNEYARWMHVKQRQAGHLWQNRFYSCPLDEGHLWEAVRYAELNPVRAGLVRTAVDWPWSSAAAHTGGRDRWGLTDPSYFSERWDAEHWHAILESGLEDAALTQRLREATRTGRPFGADGFTESLEARTGRRLRPHKRGPAPRAAVEDGQMSFGIA